MKSYQGVESTMPRLRPIFVAAVIIVSTLLFIDIIYRIKSSSSSKNYYKSESSKTCAVCPNSAGILSGKPTDRRANAVVVILARNGDLNGLKQSLPQFENRFNKKYHYPYVFLNEVEFTDEFKNGVKQMVSGKAEFGLIPADHWSYPKWIDVNKADKAREKMAKANVIYGGSLSYRHMCRFNSGFFSTPPFERL